MQQVLMCIQTGKHRGGRATAWSSRRRSSTSRAEEEMARPVPRCCPRPLTTPSRSPSAAMWSLSSASTKLPGFDAPGRRRQRRPISSSCAGRACAAATADSPTQELPDRLEYELDTIEPDGLCGLLSSSCGISSTTPRARASRWGRAGAPARAAMAAYCMGITDVDPIQYNLLFERFLNPERVSMPDFDIDFCYERRQEVIDYVVRQVRRRPRGPDHHLRHHGGPGAPSGTWAGRWTCPTPRWTQVAKLVPMRAGHDAGQGPEACPRSCGSGTTSDPQVQELIDMARKAGGHAPARLHPRRRGGHHRQAGDATMCPSAKNDDAVVTQYTMTTMEELGLLKMDFLGLRNLTVIRRRREDDPPAGSRTFPSRICPRTTRRSSRCCPQGNTDGRVPAGIRRDEAACCVQLRPDRLGGPHRRHLPVPAGAHGVHSPVHREPATTPAAVHYRHPLLRAYSGRRPTAASSTRSR